MHYTLNPLKKIFPLSMVNFSWHLTNIKHFMNILPGKSEPQASIFFQFKLFKWNIKTKVFQKEPADFLSGKQKLCYLLRYNHTTLFSKIVYHPSWTQLVFASVLRLILWYIFFLMTFFPVALFFHFLEGCSAVACSSFVIPG